MVQEEFFLVDIWFPDGRKILNVEMSQSTMNWYAENFPRVSIVQAETEVPEDIQPVDDPTDIIEEPPEDKIPVDDTPISLDSIVVTINRAQLLNTADPLKFTFVADVTRTAVDRNIPVGSIRIHVQLNSNYVSNQVQGQTIAFKNFVDNSLQGTNIFQIPINSSDLPAGTLTAVVFVSKESNDLIQLSRVATARVIFNPPDPVIPPPSGGTVPVTQISPLMPIIGAGAAIAFLSGEFPKKKKRRR